MVKRIKLESPKERPFCFYCGNLVQNRLPKTMVRITNISQPIEVKYFCDTSCRQDYIKKVQDDNFANELMKELENELEEILLQ